MKFSCKFEKIGRRWWFSVILVAALFLIPPYASRNFSFQNWGDIINQALRYAFIFNPNMRTWYPLFKILPILLIALIILFPKKTTPLFSAYTGFTYVMFTIFQNIAITEKYGITICTINLLWFPLIATFWFLEVFAGKNDFSNWKQPLWKFWPVPLAILAFWYPVNIKTMKPDFDLILAFTNCAGLTFCMMTPVYVTILSIHYPKVNIAVLRVTSLIGILIGLLNMHVNFVANPSILWWNGMLHIPLVIISLYGLILSLRKITRDEPTT